MYTQLHGVYQEVKQTLLIGRVSARVATACLSIIFVYGICILKEDTLVECTEIDYQTT